MSSVDSMSLAELKKAITDAGLSYADCIEKGDFRRRARQAVGEDSSSRTTLGGRATAIGEEEDEQDEKPFDEPEKQQLLDHWTEQALAIQLNAMGQMAAGSKRQMVNTMWGCLLVEGSAGDEQARRALRVSHLGRPEQAAAFVSAVTGRDLPDVELQEALRSGELLCDVADVLLAAAAKPPLKITRATNDEAAGQAAQSRLRAKQLENISQYVGTCLALGVDQSSVFAPEDLYENKNMPMVVKSIHALAQVAQKIPGYYGPHMGVNDAKLQGEGKWKASTQKVSDWRTMGKGSSSEELERVSSMPEVEAATDWRRQLTFIDTTELTDEEAVLVWIERALSRELPRPIAQALGSGSVLCEFLNIIRPGLVGEALCKPSAKPFEQMASVEGYIKGCAVLGVKLKFNTVDLHDARDLRAVVRQIWNLGEVAQAQPSFPGPQLGKEKARLAAQKLLEEREAAEEKEEKRRERARKRIEKDLRNEEIEAERAMLQRMREEAAAAERDLVETAQRQAKAQVEAKEAAAREKQRRRDQQIRDNTIKGYMYKRGGAAKAWKKRWFELDDGILLYYTDPKDSVRGKAPLGRLFLANASVRRPTDLKSKGKYQSTCLRLDLDPAAQGGDGGEGENPKLGARFSRSYAADTGLGVKSKDKDKTKYLIAAESAQGMTDWMDAITFWSKWYGTKERRSIIELNVTREEQTNMRDQHESRLRKERGPVQALPDDPDADWGDEEEDEEDEEEDVEPQQPEPEPTGPLEEPDKQELIDGWSGFALRFQLDEMRVAPPPPTATQRDLVEAYWQALSAGGKEHDEVARRWLLIPKETNPEEAARIWISCLTGRLVPDGPLQAALRSGELLCDMVNAIRSGIVPRVAREAQISGMSEQRRAAKCRENIGQYVDACAELGVAQRELFITADLYDDKNWKAVLKNVHGLARHCHADVEGFVGPHMGIRKKSRVGPKWGAGLMQQMSSGDLSVGSSPRPPSLLSVVDRARSTDAIGKARSAESISKARSAESISAGSSDSTLRTDRV